MRSLFRRLAVRLVLSYQILALNGWDLVCRLVAGFGGPASNRRKVVIGATEQAHTIYLLGRVFPSSYTVSLDKHRFYSDPYDFGPYGRLRKALLSPLLLAYLSGLAETFVYVWNTGFLLDREHDFRFLKRKGKGIVVLFVGSDIRSPLRTREFLAERGVDALGDHEPGPCDAAIEARQRATARVADDHADLILNWRYDQIGYLTRRSYPIIKNPRSGR